MAKRSPLTAVALVLSLAVLALGATLLVLVLRGSPGETHGDDSEGVIPRAFSEYSWDELSEVSRMISSATSDEEGREVASTYGLEVGATRSLPLEDGTVASVVIVGIRADARSDGEGVAGLTLMISPVALKPMNQADTNAGGWESSDLRRWLGDGAGGLLPKDLLDVAVPVDKVTNNSGVTNETSALTVTSDSLWLFSASEVCGEPGWFVSEYGEDPNAHTGYVDFMTYDELLAGEGSQYEYFAEHGVTGSSDPSGILCLTYRGAETPWWYRTPYPYSFTGEDASYFFQVMSSGYPSTTGLASQASGVVIGICL